MEHTACARIRNTRYRSQSGRGILFTPDPERCPTPELRWKLTCSASRPLEKVTEFMRECKRRGCRVLLLTAEKLRDADWPRESLQDMFYLPAELPLADIVKAVTHLARSEKIDRIVALRIEYDMEMVFHFLREHQAACSLAWD